MQNIFSSKYRTLQTTSHISRDANKIILIPQSTALNLFFISQLAVAALLRSGVGGEEVVEGLGVLVADLEAGVPLEVVEEVEEAPELRGGEGGQHRVGGGVVRVAGGAKVSVKLKFRDY